jgi:hypothetical protein
MGACDSSGRKGIENRSWRTNHRGWLALHASAKPDPYARFPRGHRFPELDDLPYSAICGVARLVDVVSKTRSKWFDRSGENYGWVLADVTRLKHPLPCKGALSLWAVKPSQVRAIRSQLGIPDLYR